MSEKKPKQNQNKQAPMKNCYQFAAFALWLKGYIPAPYLRTNLKNLQTAAVTEHRFADKCNSTQILSYYIRKQLRTPKYAKKTYF